jgi:ubiquinone/menaquinone biosynthesis C-methylase UbiE
LETYTNPQSIFVLYHFPVQCKLNNQIRQVKGSGDRVLCESKNPLTAFFKRTNKPGFVYPRESSMIAKDNNATYRQATQASYDRLSGWYDWLASSELRFIEAGLDMLSVRAGERVLEPGCGTGRALQKLSGQVGQHGLTAGPDLSMGMLRAARKKLLRADLVNRPLLVQADAAVLPFATGCFDAAFMAFTLELFEAEQIPLVLAEIRRVLRPAGRVCIVSLAAEANPRWPVRLYEWFHHRFPAQIDCRPIPTADFVCSVGFVIQNHQRGSMWGLPVDMILAD